MTSAVTVALGGSTDVAHPPRWRRDVEGLRAVAVLFVLVHHAGQTLWPGGFAGVDIFFVISGFVITTQLVSEVERTGRVDLVGFYSRRAKRLLPVATLVLGVTLVGAYLWASRLQRGPISSDVIGSALYVVNWLFAGRSVDYLAEDVDPSPVQHYWSLAVEEQFYLIWPVLILALYLLAQRWPWRGRPRMGHRTGSPGALRTTVGIGLGVLVVLPSLFWSIWYTASDPLQAYFVTTTRLWELGLGALVAVLAPVWSKLPRLAAVLLGWAGLLALLAGGWVLDTSMAWPGSAALWPTVATAAVLVAGFAAGPTGPVRVLGWAPMVWVGGLSYSLYLWHWPLLRMLEWHLGPLSIVQGLAVVAFSVVPAWVGYRLVEHPVRYSPALRGSPRLALSVGANLSLLTVITALLLWSTATVPLNAGARGATHTPNEPLAAGSGPEDTMLFDSITPDPTLATRDLPELYVRGCPNGIEDERVRRCLGGEPDGGITVAMVGDSKIAQWGSALDSIAQDNGWRLETYTKSACPLTSALTVIPSGRYDSCRTWGYAVVDRLVQDRPDVVVISSGRRTGYDAAGQDTVEGLAAGFVEHWSALTAAGITVLALSDTPEPGAMTVYECVAEHRGDPNAFCSWPAEDGEGSLALRAAAHQVADAHFVDLVPFVCPKGTCPAVYRNVLTYRQGSHITATYAAVLAGQLEQELVPLVAAAAAADG